MTKKKVTIPLTILAVVIVGFFIFRDNKNQESRDTGVVKTGTRIGNLAPDFELVDYNGNKVKLSDFKGKSPVFLNFWASWCPFCVDEMPLMAKVQKEFGNQYVTLAVNRGENQATGQKFTDTLGVSNEFILLNDESDSTYPKYNGFSMPYSIFIDKNGVISELKLGPLTEQELKLKLEKII